MFENSNILGIDIGSVTVAIVEMDKNKNIIKTDYEFHHGKIAETVQELIAKFEISRCSQIATTSSTPDFIKTSKKYDPQIAAIAAAKHIHNNPGSILIVGGEKFGLILFDTNGNYLKYKSNTSCAAGTGSFLDQQAGRLNLSGIEELSHIAFKNNGQIPKIASRCAVFAKTDLIHAQQEGYSLEEISDGLCYGLAKNIVDTLFSNDKPNPLLIFCGGVSKNRAVVKHIQNLINMNIVVDATSHLYGAIGAALNLIDDQENIEDITLSSPEDIIVQKTKEKKLYYEPLLIKLSKYPDFKSLDKYEYKFEKSSPKSFHGPVEVDIYEKLSNPFYDVYLGIDIGSTSTKAAIIDKNHKVLCGFYTFTAGRPVSAIQAIFETIDDVIQKKQIQFNFIATGTTGSGRKLIGKIIGAGTIIDEITAHARAAFELDPDVDTIIEIGGQDAKFTTLRNGMVTSSTMNNVCAAGTGSFIEEQAKKLGCPLCEYSQRTESQKAPMSSDRCTVFMERDLNHYLNEGYSTNEVLASVLHSIRENYLLKVANESNIGEKIFFQGATAKNKALVSAFEQKLNKPIMVSKFCHLTGAIGTALILSDENSVDTTFRGIEIYKKEIPIKSEICQLCTNHCKLTIANIDNETVAYGFLCGRDYDTKKRVNNNISNFDLIESRKKIFELKHDKNISYKRSNFTIGIPAGMYLMEDISFWKHFFSNLSIKVVTSENYKDAVKVGKNLSRAEFCAPISAMHGHVHYLIDKADYIFLPFYLENKGSNKEIRRQYCYYSQFIPSFISETIENKKFLTPIIKYLYTNFHTKIELYNVLKKIADVNFFEIANAYDKAHEFKKSSINSLKELFKKEISCSTDINAVLVGRPYTIINNNFNKGIPNIFASLGIKTFYQDMLDYKKKDIAPVKALLNELHWHYAAEIVKASEIIAKTDSLYAVFITSFKCSPDSFITDYFKKIMEANNKPYLILEIDEHDSNVGYETRIESAIRSFRNHHTSNLETKINDKTITNYKKIIPNISKTLDKKTIVFPNWDLFTCTMLVASLKREGFNAILMEETESTIQKSLKQNTGQCIPLNALAQGYIECIQKNNLNPANTVLWLMKAYIACNIKLYPLHIKQILNSYGHGIEKASVYAGPMSFLDISPRAAINAYFAFMIGGMLRKAACKLRPYEVEKGETDKIIRKSLEILETAFAGNRSIKDAVVEVVSKLEWIETKKENRVKVAIFGDIYARDNDVMNQDLIRFIEENGGEVITTPYSQYAKMIASTYFKKWFNEGKYIDILSHKALLATINHLDKIYYRYFQRIINEPYCEFNEPPENILSQYNIKLENTGESMDNILKIFYIKKQHPDISLFVQTSPAFCCPSLITEAMSKNIEGKTGVPVVSITYDGTGGYKNRCIIPYLKYPRNNTNENLKISSNW